MKTIQEDETFSPPLEKKILDDYYNYLKEENNKLQNAFEYYKKNSLIPFDKMGKYMPIAYID